MSWTWEYWSIGKRVIHRNKKGQFAKGNFHLYKDWKNSISEGSKGKIFSEEHRNKISETLTGVPLSEERKINISKGNMKTCKHGIKPSMSCIECRNIRAREWRKNNREKYLEIQRKYRKENKDKLNYLSKLRREENKDEYNKKKIEYRKKKRDRINYLQRKRRRENREEVNRKKREYYRKRKEEKNNGN